MLSALNEILWGWPMIVLLVGTHLYLTVRLRVPQRYIGRAIRLSIESDHGASGDVSQFSALATGLAATIGTGNIIGVATAVTLGGPGAVLWCWLTGVLGIATKYAEGLLAIKYRVRTPSGQMLGGPMYAIERGLGRRWRWMAVAFAVCAFIASFGIGCMVQSNAIATVAAESFGWQPAWVGAVVAVLVALIVIGGVRGIARVCESLVPMMALLYVGGCVWLLVLNAQWLWPAVVEICRRAFTPEAAGGGFVGSTMMVAMRYGVARGLFSNEAGMGSAPIVAAAAQTRNPVRQALVSSSSVFWDTVVICALTGLVLVTTIMADNGVDSSASAALTKRAFDQLPVVVGGVPLGMLVLTVAIFTFAFSTILGWSYYGERALEYLCLSWPWGRRDEAALARRSLAARRVYRSLLVAMTFVGAVWAVGAVWDFGDAANALMAVPNLVCLLLLSGVLVRETRHYLWEGRLDEQGDKEAEP